MINYRKRTKAAPFSKAALRRQNPRGYFLSYLCNTCSLYETREVRAELGSKILTITIVSMEVIIYWQ